MAIGNVSTVSGPVGATVGPAVEALRVWVRMINDRGGLNGHAVRLVAADDGGDPARHQFLVKQMVEREHVVAFVGNQEPLGAGGTVSYIEAVQVPVLGSEGGNQYFYESPMYFPQMSHGTPLFKAFLASAAEQLIPAGTKRLATIVCREAAGCQAADKLWGGGFAKEVGFDLVYRAQSSVAQPDFTAECLNARSANAQAIFVVLDANSVGRLAGACARQNYRPTIAIASNSVTPSHAADPNLDGAVISASTFPWFAGDTEATAEFQAAMGRYLPGMKVTGSHSVGWTAAKMFEHAAAAMHEPPSPGAVLEGLWRLRDDDLGGLTYPLSFTRGAPARERTCWFNVRIAAGRFTAPQGTRSSCR